VHFVKDFFGLGMKIVSNNKHGGGMFRNLLLALLLITMSCGFLVAHNSETEDRYGFDAEFPLLDRSFVETPPPVGPVRPVGEFEPASQVLIRYPLGIPVSLVAQFANVIQVVCLVANTTTQNQAISAFQSAGVNMDNVIFLLAGTNTYWTRDYGPFFIVDGNNQLGIVDFPYNRPRPLDDEIPRTFAQTYGFPLYGMNLVQTGGNYMGDSVSGGAQTTLVYTENPSLTQSQVNQRMLNYMGISNYHVLQDPNGDYIEHIDCWGKFLAPDKILIRSVPASHSQYNAIEGVASYFANTNCAWGYPYRVYRVYTPQNQPYTNSVILNKNVYVPIMNNTNDAAALQVYRDALPGYTVTGVIGASSTPWHSTDALHCRAHEVPDKEMLYVHHMPYFGTSQLQDFYDFNAYIYPHSNQPVYSDSLLVVYKVNSGQWQNTVLTNVSGSNYTTMVSGLTPGDTIRYFIHAADESGRSANHPLTGAADPMCFTWLRITYLLL
jgi:agmatine deiminase